MTRIAALAVATDHRFGLAGGDLAIAARGATTRLSVAQDVRLAAGEEVGDRPQAGVAGPLAPRVNQVGPGRANHGWLGPPGAVQA
jgi:hypothetical protein